MRQYTWCFLFCVLTTLSGVLSQPFSPASGDGVCPGSDIEFTCVSNSMLGSTTRWQITPDGGEPPCFVQHSDDDITQRCGPDRVFTSSHTGQTGLNFTSSLRAEDVSFSLNRAIVECVDGTDLQIIGSVTICIVDGLTPPEVQSVSVSERDVGETDCVVNVEWSEAFVSCGGSVSQYVFSVTPPTSDCQSSPDCEVMDGSSSVYNRSGTETQYSLTVATQEYDITVRAEACAGSLTAESSVYTVNLTGIVTSCATLSMHSPYDGSLKSIRITWTAIISHVVEYTVLIDDGVGATVRERVSALNCSATECSHTHYPAEGSRAEFGVTVEAAGCVTRQTVCQERPVYCSMGDLSPSLVEVNRVCGSVSGGGVCYSGDSVGSVAVYFCDDGYTLDGDSTRECLSSGLWNGTTPQCVETDRDVCEFDNESGVSESSSGSTTVIVVGVVCSLTFLTIGVLLGAVGVYLTLRVRSRLSDSHTSPSPTPPTVTYEEVGVTPEVKSSQGIQLKSNEAYGPVQTESQICTTENTAYGKVQL